MLIERAEQLKRELTDKYVVVSDNVAELRRFVGLTGRVKTVNMNGRALVQFDGPVDIGWYDINPDYLRVVDAPVPRQTRAAPAVEKKAAPAARPAGKSPLELARQQGAARQDAAKAEGGKKLSPLELARQQGAAKRDAAAESTSAEAKPTAPAAEGGRKLSPLELARQQGAAKRDAGAESASAEAKPAAPATEDGKKLSPLELARLQGAAKRDDGATASAAGTEEQASDVATESSTAKPDNRQDDSTAGLSKLELARRQGPFKG